MLALVMICSTVAADEPLKYSVDDLTLKYKLVFTMNRTSDGDKSAVETTTGWLTWRQKRDGDDAAVTVTVDRVTVKTDGMYGFKDNWKRNTTAADSNDRKASNAASISQHTAAKFMAGKTLRFRLKANGEIEKIAPAPALKVSIDDGKNAKLYFGLGHFRAILSDAANEQTLAVLLPQFPAKVVKVGGRWTGEKRQLERHGLVKRTFVLRSLGDSAELDFDFKVSPPVRENKALEDERAYESSIGNAEFEAERGIVKRSSLTIEYKKRSPKRNADWTSLKIEAMLALVK